MAMSLNCCPDRQDNGVPDKAPSEKTATSVVPPTDIDKGNAQVGFAVRQYSPRQRPPAPIPGPQFLPGLYARTSIKL